MVNLIYAKSFSLNLKIGFHEEIAQGTRHLIYGSLGMSKKDGLRNIVYAAVKFRVRRLIGL